MSDRNARPQQPLEEAAEPDAERWVARTLAAGTSEHYEDPVLYDYEYRRRRRDVRHYRRLAGEFAGGGPVLELGCGSGRLLVPLLRDGQSVVGVDRARPMLRACAERIQRLPTARRARAVLLQGDFRALPLVEERFPLILCPFNAFMHLYERTDVERCLAEVRRLLRPGGMFALDVLNPDVTWLGRDPLKRWARTRFRHPETGEAIIYSTSHLYDAARQVAFIRIFYDPGDPAAATKAGGQGVQNVHRGRSRVVNLAHRQFFPAELSALLHYNGFEVTRRLGGFDGEAFDHSSVEQVICARVR